MNSKVLYVISAFGLLACLLAICLLVYTKSSATAVKTEALLASAKAEQAVAKAELEKARSDFEKSDVKPEQLREQIKKLEGLVPDQAAIMTKVAYHFTNLWFAADQENWALADFYLGETRANVKWAVRSKPIRKGPNGDDINLGGISDALDKGQFVDLKKAIDAKDKAKFIETYDVTLGVCYGCHKASGKPYLRPQRPTSPEVRIINLDPNAKTPQ